ncbi:MAG: sensory box-containing diguanylate [Erysipelotrichaceae bacterium]|nr:MAG: sensory box-containing diguanylate [Erysipelotrichaceae bacterium]
MIGHKRDQVIGLRLSAINPGFNLEENAYFDRMVHVAMNGGTELFNVYVSRSESYYKVSVYSPQPNTIYLFYTDITASVKNLSDMDVFFRISPDLLSISHKDGLYLKVNPAWKKVLGYEPNEIEHKYSWQFLHQDDLSNNKTILKQLENNQQVISFVNHYRHKDGTYRVLEWDAQSDGEKVYAVARDITERNLKEAQIEYLSFHDMLTGLYNRRFLEEEIKRLDVPRNLPLTVIMGDVNRLKLVNDAFGHEKGDELIIKAAESIKNSCRPEDLIARWGGDEFMIFLPKTTSIDAQKILDRINASCAEKSVNSISVSIAFGLSTKSFLNESMNEQMRLAEDAMYKAKAKEGERSRKDIIDVIAATLFSKVPYEEQHAKRVSFLCQQMGHALNLSKDDIQKLTLAGLLHDIGKIAISTDILQKKSLLTSDEWEQVKSHTEIGAKVVRNADAMNKVGTAILYHHERYDGSGYPFGITWEKIPVFSRIIAIADSFDTMITQSAYKPCKTRIEAINEIRQNMGTQFDPNLAQMFIEKVLRHTES